MKLPASLTFLNSLSFHSLVEDRTGTRTQFRVEVSPRMLKSLLAELEGWKTKAEPNERELNDSRAEAFRYKRELEQVKSELEGKQFAIRRLNQAIEKLNAQIGEKNIDKSSGELRLHLSTAEKNGRELKGLPLQGGLPSLGKRRR